VNLRADLDTEVRRKIICSAGDRISIFQSDCAIRIWKEPDLTCFMTLRPYSTVRHQKTQKELRSKQPLTCQNSNRVPPEYKFTLLPHQSARSRRSAPLIPKQTTAYDPVHILISHFVTIQLNITLSPSPSTLQNVGTLIVSQTRSRKKVQTWMTVCQICVSRKIKYGIVIRLIPGQGVRILKYGSLPYIRENKY